MPTYCKHKDCKGKNDKPKSATYAYPGTKKRIFCGQHKEEGMINPRKDNRRCVDPSHDKDGKHVRPSYGYSTDKIPTFCIKHKKDGMIRFYAQKCKGCKKTQPSFGLLGKKATHCAKCKENDMVDLVSNLCKNIDKDNNKCQKNATQGYFGDKKASRCKKHMLPGMIDIKNPKCIGCVNDPTVLVPKQPTYGIKKATHCKEHMTKKMVDWKHKLCTSCNLFNTRNKERLCSYCIRGSKLRRSTKEQKVVQYLLHNDFEFTHNASVGFVCGSYKPDIKIDAGTHLVIVEVDEDQHKQYDSSCETIRMFNIYQAEGLKCVFIRFNPDKYKSYNEVMWISLGERLKLLKQHIKKHMKKTPKDEVTVYRMFYDNDDGELVQKYDYTEDLKQFQISN